MSQRVKVLINLEQVVKVYSGKDRKCACGCSGTYWEKGDKGFGSMALKVVNLLNRDDGYTRDMYEDTFASTVHGDRIYTAYFAD